jgi:proline iminopeptidase
LLALAAPLAGCLCASDPGNLVPKTVAEDPSLPAVAINGTRLHAESFGPPAAPTLIVLHGGPGQDYRSMLPLQALADDGYQVVFWDQRGTGLSERVDPDTIDLAVYLEDLKQVIDHYTPQHQPVVLIGHSWGAMYATAFINDRGDYDGQIRGEILSEPGAFTKKQLDAFLKRMMGSVSLVGEQFNDILWAEQFMSPADHERADFQALQFSIKGIPSEHMDPKKPTPRWRVGAAVNQRLLQIAQKGFDWTTNLSAFTHPVLFLRGDLNEACTLESQQELASSYPHATIETIENVGHEMIFERPDDYLTHTRAYLRAIGVVP